MIAALKGHPMQGRWSIALPLVLLGIRTALKEDVGCSAAELVYSAQLRLPAAFFISHDFNSCPDPSSFVTALHLRMQP